MENEKDNLSFSEALVILEKAPLGSMMMMYNEDSSESSPSFFVTMELGIPKGLPNARVPYFSLIPTESSDFPRLVVRNGLAGQNLYHYSNFLPSQTDLFITKWKVRRFI